MTDAQPQNSTFAARAAERRAREAANGGPQPRRQLALRAGFDAESNFTVRDAGDDTEEPS